MQRLLSGLFDMLIVTFGVVTLVFFLIHLIPGDPVEVMLGESARAADKAALRHQLGLDRPLLSQLGNYYVGLANLDLGESLQRKQAVAQLLAERLPATAWLTLAAFGISLSLAVPLGVIAAMRVHRWQDHAASGFALLGLSIPNFWLGPLLILLFSITLGLTPVSGAEGPASLILPALTLGTSLAAITTRMIRSTLLEVLGQDFIRTAAAKGEGPYRIVLRHALPNAGLPVLTLLGLQLGALLAGAVITETIFAWPGIGGLTIEAIQQRDYPLVQGCVLLISLIYILINRLTDILYTMLDPRTRGQG